MIWFFERGGQHLRCEIREAPDGHRFDLVITGPGADSVETFTDWDELNRRRLVLEHRWQQEGWRGPYGRDV